MNEKITISWDELKTRQVDQRVNAMQAMRRNREYAQLTDAPEQAATAMKSLWYNTIVYMTVFGLFGGLLAWGCGALLHFRNSARLEASQLMTAVNEIKTAAAAGRMSEEERATYIEQLARDGRNNPYFTIHVDERLSSQQKAQLIEQVSARDAWKEFISNMLAFGVSGMIIALALSIAEPVVSRNVPSAIISGSVGATLGLIGGVVVALFVEKMYHAMGGTDGNITTQQQILARVVQWSVIGCFLALGPGVVMRNWKKLLIGLLGGAIGGAVGGALFDIVWKFMGGGASNQDLSRMIGLAAIGLVAGAAGGLIENAAKSGWLKVTHGLIAGKQFILYRNPTFIGSSPDNQIYLFKDPQVGRRHAAIHIVKGGFELEDLPLGSATMVNGRPVARQRLRSGDQVTIGGSRFLFQEKQPSNLAPGSNGNGRH
jgi:hypothetical protein